MREEISSLKRLYNIMETVVSVEKYAHYRSTLNIPDMVYFQITSDKIYPKRYIHKKKLPLFNPKGDSVKWI